jgi:amidase
MSRYLSEYAPGSRIHSLQDIIDFNIQHRDMEMRYFDQELLIRAQAKTGLDSPEYLAALANNQKMSRAEGIDKVLNEQRLDALFAPTGGPAWLNDYVNGDHTGDGFTSPAAVAGYPHITVPAGYFAGLPIGISLVGAAYAEATLLRLAYSFEQATRHRRVPTFSAHNLI